MNVLQATVGNKAYPPDTGGYQRTHGLTCSFPAHGDTVTRYCCSGPAATQYSEGTLLDETVEVKPGIVEHRNYSLLHDVPKVCDLLGYPATLWQAVFRTWAGDSLLSEARRHDVAIADNPYLALFLAENADVPVVYSSHNIEYQRFRSTTDGRLAQRLIDHLETVERRAASTAALVACTTADDRAEFSKVTSSTVVVPNGISGAKLTGETGPADRGVYDVPDDAVVGVFLGSDYGPNVEAAEWLADNWGRFDDRYHLIIVGDAGDGIDPAAGNVSVTGYVEDLQAVLRMADIGLNPIFSGGGSNVKLIEYFAAGLPVVSTPFGARGFDLDDGESIVIGERDQFFDAVRELATDETRREAIGDNAHDLAGRRYTWESLSEQFRAAVRPLV